MTEAEAFLKNEKPNEYEASFRVDGEVRVTIRADSLEEAKAKANAMLEDEEFGLELNGISAIDVGRVWKSAAMFLVTRGGKVMQVSHLADGDQPREPTEAGF